MAYSYSSGRSSRRLYRHRLGVAGKRRPDNDLKKKTCRSSPTTTTINKLSWAREPPQSTNFLGRDKQIRMITALDHRQRGSIRHVNIPCTTRRTKIKADDRPWSLVESFSMNKKLGESEDKNNNILLHIFCAHAECRRHFSFRYEYTTIVLIVVVVAVVPYITPRPRYS